MAKIETDFKPSELPDGDYEWNGFLWRVRNGKVVGYLIEAGTLYVPPEGVLALLNGVVLPAEVDIPPLDDPET